MAEEIKILVVDDSPSSREILAGILEAEGWRVVEADDGGKAIDAARRYRPDLILLDVIMPGQSGYEVCEQLQRESEGRNAPIIFISALSDPTDKVEGLRRGAVDYVAKPFDPGEVVARVQAQLRIQRLTRELLAANRSLTAKQARIEEDLQAAADIQRCLIPRHRVTVPGLDIAWRFLPCEQVGGDLFQICGIGPQHLGAYVIDVSGHGVPAAMITVSLSQTLAAAGGILGETGNDGVTRPRSPADVMKALDRDYPVERFERHFTIAYVLFDRKSGELRYSSAGHPSPLHVRPSGAVEPLAAGGTIIGLGGVVPFEEGTLRLSAGDRVFLYTDGVVEFRSGADEAFGLDRLCDVLRSTRELGLQAACDRVVDALQSFGSGAPFQDDVTVVGLELQAKGGERETTPGPRAVLQISADSRLEEVRRIAAAVRRVCRELSLADRDAYEIETAVVEGVNNVILHAYGEQAGFPVEVGMTVDGDVLVVEVTDAGKPMTEVPAAAASDAAPSLEESGRGWQIMRAWMDEVTYASERGRNTLRLRRRLQRR